jgi:hypothetical protein
MMKCCSLYSKEWQGLITSKWRVSQIKTLFIRQKEISFHIQDITMVLNRNTITEDEDTSQVHTCFPSPEV